MPTRWYNIVPDLPSPPPPPLHPGTLQPRRPRRPRAAVPDGPDPAGGHQDRYVDIPDEVLDVYRLWRPSPLYRAHRLEKALGTPARIYYKYEGVSPAGLAQAEHRGAAGLLQRPSRRHQAHDRDRRRAVGHRPGLRLRAFRPRVRGVAGRRVLRREALPPLGDGDLRRHGAPQPVRPHRVGPQDPRRRRRPPRQPRHRDQRGGRGGRRGRATHYALGSVLNHVLLHQTVIGEEALLQFAKVGETPDLIVGCTGGGSNFAGLSFPFLREKLAGRMHPTIRAVEPASCPSLTRGTYAYDFGDTAGFTPLLKMHTLGHDFIPDPIHAGGLRYHGMCPLISHVYELGLMEAVAIAADSSASRRPSRSPAPRASCRRPSRRTRWRRASARRWPARSPARRR